MKISNILFVCLAAVAVSACQTEKYEEMSGNTSQKVVIIAETESVPQSKTAIGLNGDSKPQTLWEDGDKITIYSSGNDDVNKVMYAFETSLSAPSASATFVYEGNDFVEGDNYLAIYPHTATSTRDANFASTRMAQVDIPAFQTLVPCGYDRSAAIMLAYSDCKESMKFMNAVSLVKFQVADDNVTSGSFKANGVAIAGRFRGDVVLDENGVPCGTDLAIYSSGSTNAPTSTLNFSLAGGTPLVPGTDYYVAVRPTSIEDGFSVSLNGELVKTYDIRELKRNTVYNLGVLSLPEKEDTPEGQNPPKVLTFDFTSCPAGWPNADGWTGDSDSFNYVLDGNTYEFLCADCIDGTSNRTFWNKNGYIVLNATGRYLGLPVLDGYRLTSVSLKHGTSAKTRKVAIASEIVDSKSTPAFVKGGELRAETFAVGANIVFNLTGTEFGTRYYVYTASGIGFTSITLTYDSTTDKNETTPSTVRVGTYNVRYINDSETDENNLWENRKERVISSIHDNDFDVFGVNECSTGIKEYFETELASTYAGEYFNPYSATGVGDSDKVEFIGILYKKDKFTLSQGHKFWLATTLEASETRPAGRNDTNGEYTYYRGGYCCVLTQKSTGENIFVMISHGCLDADKRAEYAAIYEAVEKAYNPNGYPAFFAGDLNARPSDPASVIYRTYWNDPYRELPGDKIIGPFATYNGFNLKLNLDVDGRRLDYVYYRNATPQNYVCNDKKYEGYYASDHLPVYSDFVITK